MAEPLGASYLNLDPLRTRIETHRLYSERPDDVEQAVLDVLDPGLVSLLDVGPGTGTFLARLSDMSGERKDLALHAIDTSPAAVDAAAAVAGVTAVLGDACSLPYPDQSFDCVTARHMLYHVTDLTLALKEASRVLRPGRPLMAVVNHRESWPHLRRMLHEVSAAVGSQPPGPSLNERVNTENLPRAMATAFVNVRVLRHDNALIFDCSEPLVAYAAVSPTFTGLDRDSPLFKPFMAELQARLDRRFESDPTPWRDPKGFSVVIGESTGRSHPSGVSP